MFQKVTRLSLKFGLKGSCDGDTEGVLTFISGYKEHR